MNKKVHERLETLRGQDLLTIADYFYPKIKAKYPIKKQEE